jgi:hypothetical protein
LYKYYVSYLNNENFCLIFDIGGFRKVELVDSSTISLFCEIFKRDGRNRINGAKKSLLKIHSKLPLGGVTPNVIHISEAACNDKSFLGELIFEPNTFYVFDKGYANYKRWQEINDKIVSWLKRLNKNAKYETVSIKRYN